MNRFIFCLLLILFLLIKSYSQEKISTQFYELNIPTNSDVKLFDKSCESLANIDVYQFAIEGKPKYILYMMSNKISDKVKVNIDNYKDFLFDLGDLNVLDASYLGDKIKVSFIYNNKKNINGITYIYIQNDILNRFVFLLPNESARNAFSNEIEKMIESTILLKNIW